MEIRKDPRNAGAPVLVVTAHGHDRPDLAVEVMKAGATDFVKKPFDNLDQAIREALEDRQNGGQHPATGEAGGDAGPRTLDGATLVFRRDRIELAGVTVCTADNGLIWRILMLLRERRDDGRPRAIPGKAIAEHLGLLRGQSAVCDAVSAFRRRLVQVLAAEGIEATDDSLIVTGRAGYQVNTDLAVEDLSGSDADSGVGSETIGAEERQAWFVGELEKGVKLRRRDLEEQFGVSTATAKRDLGAISDRVEFVGTGGSGHYKLREGANRA